MADVPFFCRAAILLALQRYAIPLWSAGTLAGLLYAWAMLRRGRISEAVIAHATTNALIAAYVLIFHRWHL